MVSFSVLFGTGLTLVVAVFVFYCQNGRRNLTSSMNEASRDLIVHTHSKKKQALLVGFSIYIRYLGSTCPFFKKFHLLDSFLPNSHQYAQRFV